MGSAKLCSIVNDFNTVLNTFEMKADPKSQSNSAGSPKYGNHLLMIASLVTIAPQLVQSSKTVKPVA